MRTVARRRRQHFARRLVGDHVPTRPEEQPVSAPPSRTPEEIAESRAAIEDFWTRMGWQREKPALEEAAKPESQAEYNARRQRILDQARELRERAMAEVSKNCDLGDHHLCAGCVCACHHTAAAGGA